MNDGMEEATPPWCNHVYVDEEGFIYCSRCGERYVV